MGFFGYMFLLYVNCILYIFELFIRCEIFCLFIDKDLVDEDEVIDEVVDIFVVVGNDYKKGSLKKCFVKKGEVLVFIECDWWYVIRFEVWV